MNTLALLAAMGSLAVAAAPVAAADMSGSSFALTDGAAPMAPNGVGQFTQGYGGWDDDDRRYGRGRYYRDDDYYDRYDRRDRREARRIRSRDQIWRGRDGRYYCDRGDGTTGLVVGAVGGALLGRVIDRHGDRTVGTLLGGALGAVIGREIDRSELSCR